MSGIRLTRGYIEPTRAKDIPKNKNNSEAPIDVDQDKMPDKQQQRKLKRRSAPPSTGLAHQRDPSNSRPPSDGLETPRARLQRQISSLMEEDGKKMSNAEEQLQQQEELEIQDYHTQAGESQGRQIDHLILVTHGIGQQLSLRYLYLPVSCGPRPVADHDNRMDSVNFVHDVNALRKTLKSTYSNSADLKALNSELNKAHGNCRVQVLPVCWRHLLNFPKQRKQQHENDLDEMGDEDDSCKLMMIGLLLGRRATC